MHWVWQTNPHLDARHQVTTLTDLRASQWVDQRLAAIYRLAG
jgi:hypothetical protein